MILPRQLSAIVCTAFTVVLGPGLCSAADLTGAAPAQLPACYTNSLAYRRWHWMFEQRAFPLGYIPAEAKAQALQQINTASSHPLVSSAAGDQWVNIGPGPIPGGQIGTQSGLRPMSGRLDAIAADPANSNHWLVGGADGGIWETFDGGTNWASRTDAQASLAMGVLAFAPGDHAVVYAGTGAAWFSSDAFAGAGLLKSLDGGSSWQLMATSTFANISFSRLRVNQTNASILAAATTRGFFGRDGQYPPTLPARGIFESANGGTIWSLALGGEATALEVDPGNFLHQYAGLGEIFGAATNGVYRSIDGGNTWNKISGPWTTASGGVGRIELALSPSNPDNLYLSIQDSLGSVANAGGLLGLWRSTNAWAASPSWVNIPVNATDDGSGVLGYCGWDPAYKQAVKACWATHILIVDPNNPNVLYAGGVPLWKFDGTTWTEVSKTVSDPAHGIKVDQHALAWSGNRLLVGNDGGLWSSTDSGSTWNDHNGALFTIQFIEGALHPTQPDFALAGSQDHGTDRWAGTNGWPLIFGGDGGSTAVSSSTPDQDWAFCAQQLQIFRTLNGGAAISRVDSGIDKTGVPFIARLKKSPSNDDIFIGGTDKLWKCTNFFGAATPTWFTNSPAMGSSLSALAFAPSDSSSSTYALGTAKGLIQVTTNGGVSWTDADPANGVPNRYVTDLAFNPTNSSILYVSLSGFDQGTPSQPGHLFRTSNALSGSPAWSNVSPPVNLPHDCLALDPNDPTVMYAGSDLGIWRSTNSGTSWQHMGPATGMPNVAVFDIKISPNSARTIAFTHGRSAFALVNSSLLGQLKITSLQPNLPNVQIGFTTDLNNVYRVERSAFNPPNIWSTAVDGILGTGGIVQTNDTPSPGPVWFYRIKRL